MHDPTTSDLIFTNANIITLDPGHPQAELVAIRSGKVLSLGHNWELKKFRCGSSKVIDCRGKTVLPGFIDAHLHLPSFAESLVTMNLGPRNDVRSISDIQAKIRQLSGELPHLNFFNSQLCPTITTLPLRIATSSAWG